MPFVGSIAKYITLIFTIGYLHIFKAACFFPQKYCHGLYKPQDIILPSKIYSVTQKKGLQTRTVARKFSIGWLCSSAGGGFAFVREGLTL